MVHAWRAYADRCMGCDELRPISGTANSWGGFGLTILDSLDTLILMGLTDEYAEARAWCVKNLRFDKGASVGLSLHARAREENCAAVFRLVLRLSTD